MIKVEANEGKVFVEEVSGNGISIMSELCYIVKAVCTGFASDEEDSKKFSRGMVLCVAKTLARGELENWGADLEDDENADF